MSRLNTNQAGQGPVFVMLHGLFGSLDNFRSVALNLEQSLNVVRVDLPGHGKSPSLPVLSIEAMADAVASELENLGIREFHLLGHSLGGKVAMSMAGRRLCKGLLSLIVVDIAPRQYPPHHDVILQALSDINLHELVERKTANTLLESTIPDAGIRAFLLKSLYRQETGLFGWRFDLDQLHTDYPEICKPPVIDHIIEPSVLFIKGGNSNYLENTDEPLIRKMFRQPVLKVIEGAGHWPHAEKPALFTRICQNFVHSV